MKKRLDVILTEKGYFESREKAQASIMAGLVFIKGQRCDKAGTKFDEDIEPEVRGSECPYVSRGGFKLEKAIKVFNIDLAGKHCIDIGASTGGFTDCMLKNGAEKVYSVDVGTNQLAWSLRSDPRVVCMEKLNFRYIEADVIPEKLDFACCDVSFISIKHILPNARMLLKDEASAAFLIKPQFEAGREQVGKNGIIKDPAVHRSVIENALGYAKEAGFYVSGLDFSPVKGAKGNIEFLMYLTCFDTGFVPDIDYVLNTARELNSDNTEKE